MSIPQRKATVRFRTKLQIAQDALREAIQLGAPDLGQIKEIVDLLEAQISSATNVLAADANQRSRSLGYPEECGND